MTPTMTGQTLERIDPDNTLDIYTVEGGMLRVENEYVLERPLEPVLRTTDGQEAEIVDALERLVGTRVAAVDMGDGRLVVTFQADARLVVEVDDSFEAWSYIGPHDERVVCMPGGELAIWE